MEDRILKAITHLTGLTPIEEVTEDRYCLKLFQFHFGTIDSLSTCGEVVYLLIG
ncbi:MAG: hypothetical protein WC998_07535 [Candidatus Paceibacterota bacterium]